MQLRADMFDGVQVLLSKGLFAHYSSFLWFRLAGK